jgi:lysM domain protein
VEQEKVEKQEVIPEKTEPAPEVKPKTVRYLIKWGDTLWDLSDTYYRNPWLYPIIARENKIKNPDLIIAGTYINIPPR